MDAQIADLVYPVLNAGISLRDRLEANEQLDWHRERAALKNLLANLQTDATVLDALEPDEIGFDFVTPDDWSQRALKHETIRFVLIGWLDEFLGSHSAWGSRWREETLEVELYGSRTSQSKFWDEARYAETRGDLDTLEVVYLCVMLGFHGDCRANPNQLEAWAKRVGNLLTRTQTSKPLPTCLMPGDHERTLPADAIHRSMVFLVLLSLTLAIPVATMLAWRF